MRRLRKNEGSGTCQTFTPDFSIMDRNEFDYDILLRRFREMAFVTRSVHITLCDERNDEHPREISFFFQGGLHSFVRHLNWQRSSLHEPVHAERDVEIAPVGKAPLVVSVELAFQYTDTPNVTELAFANTIATPDGGSHITGMRTALTSVINRHARKSGLLREKEANFSGSDTLEGLTAVISIKHPDPQFESQTKVKLLNPEVQGAVSQVLSEAFQEYLDVNPRVARRIVDKWHDEASGPARRPARPATSCAVAQVCWRAAPCPANWPTVPHTGRNPKSISLRETAPVAAPSRAGTATFRRFCPCAAKSSTQSAPEWTRCSTTTRSRP